MGLDVANTFVVVVVVVVIVVVVVDIVVVFVATVVATVFVVVVDGFYIGGSYRYSSVVVVAFAVIAVLTVAVVASVTCDPSVQAKDEPSRPSASPEFHCEIQLQMATSSMLSLVSDGQQFSKIFVI